MQQAAQCSTGVSKLFSRGQAVNIWGFASHVVYVGGARLCRCCGKAITGHVYMNELGCAPVKYIHQNRQ